MQVHCDFCDEEVDVEGNKVSCPQCGFAISELQDEHQNNGRDQEPGRVGEQSPREGRNRKGPGRRQQDRGRGGPQQDNRSPRENNRGRDRDNIRQSPQDDPRAGPRNRRARQNPANDRGDRQQEPRGRDRNRREPRRDRRNNVQEPDRRGGRDPAGGYENQSPQPRQPEQEPRGRHPANDPQAGEVNNRDPWSDGRNRQPNDQRPPQPDSNRRNRGSGQRGRDRSNRNRRRSPRDNRQSGIVELDFHDGGRLVVEDDESVGREIREVLEDQGMAPQLVKGVSRQHLLFNEYQEGCYVQDLDSLNGTWLNGEQLEPNTEYEIRDGDELELGTVTTATVHIL